jgi:hypothetical protein
MLTKKVTHVSDRGFVGAAILLASMLCAFWGSDAAKPVGNRSWPRITEATFKAHFSPQQGRVFKQIIVSDRGDALYILDARLPSDKGDADVQDYDYSGAFDCRLYTVVYPIPRSANYPSLLMNDGNATADWQTDGRFLAEELIPLADFNGTRTVVQRSRLRGMSVKIEVGNVVVDRSRKNILSFDAKFTFRNDPSAISDIAVPPE